MQYVRFYVLLTIVSKQLQLVFSNNTTFSTHTINAIKSAYANLACNGHVPLLNCLIQTLTIYTF
jgi:hypothetical protein